jgi:hypothetical protein
LPFVSALTKPHRSSGTKKEIHEMNRRAVSLPGALVLLSVAAAPAHAAGARSDIELGVRYSQQANVTLAPTLVSLQRHTASARARVNRALVAAGGLERRGQAAAVRAVARARRSGAVAIGAAGQVLVRLDNAGSTEVSAVRGSADPQVQQHAAADVELTAELTGGLDTGVARSIAAGNTGAQISAAQVIAAQSSRDARLAAQIVSALPTTRSKQARDALVHALALLLRANQQVTATLPPSESSANAGARPSIGLAMDLLAQSSGQIAQQVAQSGEADQQVSVSASSDSHSEGTVSLGDLASETQSGSVNAIATAKAAG